MYKRELCKDFHLYSDGSIKFKTPVMVHIPHVFTCEVLVAERSKYSRYTTSQYIERSEK
ncbi:MAG: hypothetical protein RR205_04700 [Oscillospiraceae bacterium]